MSGERSEPGLVPSETTHPGFLLAFSKSEAHRKRIASMRRAVWGAGQWLNLRSRGWRAWFLTLTYRPGVAWSAEHITRCMDRVRKWSSARGVKPRYVWTAELTKKGVMHYHVAVWLPRALSMPMPDKQGWWPHGMTQRALAIAPVGYLMKYVSKGESLGVEFPKGARIYGTGGLCADGRAVRGWLNLPEWAKRLHGVGELCRRAGRLVVRATGEILDSPYRVERVPGGLLLRLTRELPPKFHGAPYSSWPCRIEVVA